MATNNLTVVRGHAGSGASTNLAGTGSFVVARTHADGSLVTLIKGNANADDDYFGWGQAASGGLTTTTQIRLWSHDNFGEDLLINPRDSNIFYWERSLGVSVRAKELSTIDGTKTSVPTKCKQVMVSDRDRHVLAGLPEILHPQQAQPDNHWCHQTPNARPQVCRPPLRAPQLR